MIKDRFIIRVGKKGDCSVDAWATMFVDKKWFKIATDYTIAKLIRNLFREVK